MNCPVCKTPSLQPDQLLEGLPAQRCTTCAGQFISSTAYWAWLKSQTLEPGIPLDDTDASRVEAGQARICPDCGHLLMRTRVWPNVNFQLDSCGHCNGIWLDRDEWHTLQAHHLHNRINLFITRPWQEKLRQIEAGKRFDAMYLERFGAEDYARIKEIRAWLNDHPRRQALLAFLADPDPYKA